MQEFTQKRKIVTIVFNSCVVLTLAFMFLAPLFGAWFKANTKLYFDINTVLILVSIAVTFVFSRYKKAGIFVDRIAAEIRDCGHYITAVQAETAKDYETVVYNYLNEDFFTVRSDIQLPQREFSFKAMKKNETLFFARCKKLTLQDFFEYSDAVNADTAASSLRQKRTVVLFIAADKIDDDVLAYSKMTTAIRKTMIYPMLVDVSNSHAYFFNDGSQRLTFAFKNALGYPSGKIEQRYQTDQQLPFQKELEKKMLLFSIKEYREGRFNPRS